MTPRYSIIIPHHNIPDLLQRCLSSIPQRNDLQVIVIDDKSDERYIPLLNQIEKEYSWIKFVYSKAGKGAGHTRNIGLEYAEGEYILFADADDYFTYCLGKVLDDYKENLFDIIFFNAISLDTDTYTASNRSIHLNEMIKEYNKNPNKAIVHLKYTFGEPWCKIINHELIKKNGIRFSETIIHNDTKFSYLVGYYGQNIKIDTRAIYCVTDRKGSVSKKVSLDRLLTRTDVFSEANFFFKSHNINIFDERSLRPFIGLLIKLDITHAKQCIQIMKQNGMTTVSIFFRCFSYPFYLITKSRIGLKKFLFKYIYT